MKKGIALSLLALLAISNAYASYPQTVNACVMVQGNTSAHHFKIGFGSTDFFDHGNWSNTVFTGITCASHTYSHGPKNLSFGVGDSYDPSRILIRPDKSCYGVFNSHSGWVETNYLKTIDPEQSWMVTLTQSSPSGVYQFVFDMRCKRTGE